MRRPLGPWGTLGWEARLTLDDTALLQVRLVLEHDLLLWLRLRLRRCRHLAALAKGEELAELVSRLRVLLLLRLRLWLWQRRGLVGGRWRLRGRHGPSRHV